SIELDISSYPGINIRGGIGFNGQLIAQYFFSPSVGAYAGLGVVGRKMTLNSSANPLFLDIPFGLAFQYRSNPTMRNTIGIGLFYAQPLGDFPDTGGTEPLQGVLGLDLQLNTYFHVSEAFELGFGSTFRFGFSSVFAAYSSPLLLGIDIGVSGRIHL
ncbi:hypothetical protein K2X33_11185, partial [bacterium]|nr:hypothetical protein [bacterium]